MIDALAYEAQFLDHLAPLWHMLPEGVRGTFIVDPQLIGRARELGIGSTLLPVPRPDILRGRLVPRVPGGPTALVASYGDTKEARRLGYGDMAYLEHGIGQSYGRGHRENPSYSGGPDRDDTSLFLVPGPHPAERWREAYPGARVEVVGSPRLDDLPRRAPGPGPVVAVSFHWPAPIGVSGYAGTAIGEHSHELRAIAEAYTTIGHAHPKGDWQERARRTFDRAGIPFVEDFAEVCRRADVYVCDNSSTIYEFAATGRPVVLLNAGHWHRNGPELGLRFWAAAHVGQNVAPGDLRPAVIARALEDRQEDAAAREDALSLVYGYRTGGAKRAADAVVRWHAERARGSRREVPPAMVRPGLGVPDVCLAVRPERRAVLGRGAARPEAVALMAGIRLQHPTARNVRFSISEPDHPYPSGPYQCTPPEFGGCGQVHIFKTHHLNIDETGSTIVGDVLFEKARGHILAAGFEIANEVLDPPTLGIGLGPHRNGSGAWGNIPIVRRGEGSG